ncbi:hypothetical protein GCM10010841_07290 [Deinococcus aerophilus]|uniref:YlxR domain-containing protein n=1 Tax=Deinococcus aerophilus TaxID=522488 RepID=A0ABQ2GLM8_9DEIO|nr:hypothetical protein GCM10010841_07290 [Deinococcus aerophilus]
MNAAALQPPHPGRHVPERTCVACRRKRPQHEFVRITREGGVWALRAGKRSGRGAYVCADSPACWQDKRLRRAFGAQAGALSAQLHTSGKPHHDKVLEPPAAPPPRPARPSPEVSDVESPNLYPGQRAGT